MKKAPNSAQVPSDKGTKPEVTRVQKLIAELVREAVKEKLKATHCVVQLRQFQHGISSCFSAVEAGENLLVLRKLDPVAMVHPLSTPIPALPHVDTVAISQDYEGLMKRVEKGSSFIIERSKRGPNSDKRDVALLLPPPQLTPEELEQIRAQINAVIDELKNQIK